MFPQLFKDKRTVRFVRLMNGIPTVISSKTISPSADKITFKGITWNFDVSAPAYRTGRTFIYLVDIRSGQMSFKEPMNPVSAALIDRILNRAVIAQLVSGLKKQDFLSLLVYVLVGVCMALPLGYILGNLLPF